MKHNALYFDTHLTTHWCYILSLPARLMEVAGFFATTV